MRATLFWFAKNVEFKFVAGHFQKQNFFVTDLHGFLRFLKGNFS